MKGYFITAKGDMGHQSVLGPIEPEAEDIISAMVAVERNDIWLADQLEDWKQEDSK